MRLIYWLDGDIKEAADFYDIPVDKAEAGSVVFDSQDSIRPFGTLKVIDTMSDKTGVYHWVDLHHTDVPPEFKTYLLVSGYIF